MDPAKRQQLEAAGSTVSSVKDFLGLTEDEAKLVEERTMVPSASQVTPNLKGFTPMERTRIFVSNHPAYNDAEPECFPWEQVIDGPLLCFVRDVCNTITKPLSLAESLNWPHAVAGMRLMLRSLANQTYVPDGLQLLRNAWEVAAQDDRDRWLSANVPLLRSWLWQHKDRPKLRKKRDALQQATERKCPYEILLNTIDWTLLAVEGTLQCPEITPDPVADLLDMKEQTCQAFDAYIASMKTAEPGK